MAGALLEGLEEEREEQGAEAEVCWELKLCSPVSELLQLERDHPAKTNKECFSFQPHEDVFIVPANILLIPAEEAVVDRAASQAGQCCGIVWWVCRSAAQCPSMLK